ncbi:MAG: TonB-dependent receptor [Myxococcales bacterium]|nr:TonB-dependent receptor [Myxococcales bacterium]
MAWLLAALGSAWAGITVDPAGWPEDVRLPEPLGCEVAPLPGWVAVEARVDGSVGVDGAFLTDQDGPSADAARACRFAPAVFQGDPAEVPVTLVVVHPEPAVTLTVRLLERGQGTPLSGARLAVGEQVVITDADGVASFRGVDGAVTVASADSRIVVEPVETGPGEVEAWGVPEDGWELVARYSPTTDRAGTQVITREELVLSPGVVNDPVRAVSMRPGVVRTPFESGWLLIRGGDPGDDVVTFDGVRIPLLYHLGGFASVIPAQMVEEVRFWPGVGPARYGRTLSGVVEVVPPRAPTEATVDVGANVVFAHGSVTAPTRVGTLQVGLRRSYLDAVMTALLGAEQARIAPRFWDVHARLAGDVGSLTFFALSDAIDAPTGVDDQTVEIRQDAVQLQGRFDQELAEDVTLRITPWISRWRRTIDGRAEPQSTDELFPGTRIELRTRGRIGLTAGAEAELRRYTIRQGTSARRAPGGSIDPYVDVRLDGPVQVDVGTRLETLFVGDQLPRFGHAPRALVRWRPHEAFAVHAGLARTWRSPDPLFLVGLADGAYLPLERGDTGEAGVEVRGQGVQLGVTGWARRMVDLAGFEVDGSLGGLSGRARGVETQLVLQREGAMLRALYQYTWTRRNEDGRSALYPPPWDQPHRVQIVGFVQLPKRWRLASRFRYSSPFPAPRQDTDAYDLLTGRVEQLVADGGRLSAFGGLDLKVSRTFLMRRWSMDGFLDLQNVLDRRIFEPIITGIDDTFPAYSKGLPILPVLGFEAHVRADRKAR